MSHYLDDICHHLVFFFDFCCFFCHSHNKFFWPSRVIEVNFSYALICWALALGGRVLYRLLLPEGQWRSRSFLIVLFVEWLDFAMVQYRMRDRREPVAKKQKQGTGKKQNGQVKVNRFIEWAKLRGWMRALKKQRSSCTSVKMSDFEKQVWIDSSPILVSFRVKWCGYWPLFLCPESME